MFLLTFLLYPFVEILVFCLVAKATSFFSAIGLSILTTFLGIVIAKLQRRGPIFGASGSTNNSLKNYLFGNLGAFALILPGFLTDVIGILILIPFTRNLLLSFFKLCHINLYGNANGTFSVFKTWSFDENGRVRTYEQELRTASVQESDYSDYVDGEFIDGEYIDVNPAEVKTITNDVDITDRNESAQTVQNSSSNVNEDTIDVSYVSKH